MFARSATLCAAVSRGAGFATVAFVVVWQFVAAAAPARAAISPLSALAWEYTGGVAGVQLGDSVSTAGDVNGDGYSDVLVSAPFWTGTHAEEGRVLLFLGSVTGLSAAPAWTMDGGQDGANFGVAVSTAGDVNGDGYADVIVGANRWDGAFAEEGRATLFLGSAQGLSTTAAWSTTGGQTGAWYGHSVATAGDINGDGYDDVLVGADQFDNGHVDEGRAFLFLGGSTGLSTSPAWTADGDSTDAYFGVPAVSAGDVNGDGFADIAVGGWRFTYTQTGEGCVRVYLGSASGIPSAAVATLLSHQGAAGLGNAVSAAGDVNGDGYADLLVGASRYYNLHQNGGRCFLYRGSAAGIDTTAAWSVFSDDTDSRMGGAVATAGDVNGDGFADVLVAAWNGRDGQSDEGLVYLYLGSPAGFDSTAAWTIEGDQVGAHCGWSVATAGDVNGDGLSDVVIGAPLWSGSHFQEGHALLFLGRPAGLASSASWTVNGTQAGAGMGSALVAIGDVNGDGFVDMAAAAPMTSATQLHAGLVQVYYGSAAGLPVTASWTAAGVQGEEHWGAAVAGAGDVNGDGYDDLLIGAPGAMIGAGNGRAVLYLGSSTGLRSASSWMAHGTGSRDLFGAAVAGIGDVNGDGFADVAIGATGALHGTLHTGAALVFLGRASGPDTLAAWAAYGSREGALAGTGLAGADVNRDGFTDVVMGAPGDMKTLAGEGRVQAFAGGATGLSATAAWTVYGGQSNAACGSAVASAGDVNADGYADILVGAPFATKTFTSEGLASLYLGSATGLGVTAAWTATGGSANGHFGSALGTAGDQNGDGATDIVIGAPDQKLTLLGEGVTRMFASTSAGMPETNASWVRGGGAANARSGVALTAGDVDGDGFADVLIGAPGATPAGLTGAGTTTLLRGNNGRGQDRRAQQLQSDGVTPLAQLGVAKSAQVNLRAQARSAAGRVRVRLEFQLASITTPLASSSRRLGATILTGAPAAGGSVVTVSQAASATGIAGAKHWRSRVASLSPYFPYGAWHSVGLASSLAAFRTLSTSQSPLSLTAFTPAVPAHVAPLVITHQGGTITFRMTTTSATRVEIFAATGRRVADLSAVSNSSDARAVWNLQTADGQPTAHGVYFARATTVAGALVAAHSFVVTR